MGQVPSPNLKSTGQGTAELSGDLTLHTVADLVSQGEIEIEATATSAITTWQLDLQNVGRFSSAGVALLLSWLRLCVARNITMSVINAPEDMRGILKVCDLEDVFGPIIAQV